VTLRVGQIAYANCAPFFQHLRACGFREEIVSGVPAELNRLLAAGGIDLSPSSSFEYARSWRDYLLLPDLSISSRGPVRSVCLFAAQSPKELRGEIVVTAESATSVNLLQVLLKEYLGNPPVTLVPESGPVEAVIARGGAALLIGDRALRAAQKPPAGCGVYDLGELWWQATGLPFVFALWIVRRAAAAREPAALRQVQQQLGCSLARALADLPGLATHAPEGEWMGEEALVAYWRSMTYRLDAEHLAGLELFFAHCVRHGLLAETPELHFLP
jgi:chorismate dehydratase